MWRLLNITLLDCHSTFLTIMCSFTFILFMLNDIHSLYTFLTINAWHMNIWTNSFMSINFFPDTFSFAFFISFTDNRLELALFIMTLNINIVQNIIASLHMISAFELHFLKFLFNIFLYAYKFWILTLHWTHSNLIMKFL